MNDNNKHSHRLAFLLALAVVALLIASFDQLQTTGGGQQAAVLRMYAE